MKHLVDNNRRLEHVGAVPVPVNPTDEEKHIISAGNYAKLQPRLLKLKTFQDHHIARLSCHILEHPEVIKVVPGEAGASDARYELMSNDGNLQRAFKGFAKEGPVMTAIETALKSRQSDGNDIASSASMNNAVPAAGATQEPVVSPSTHNPAAASAAETMVQRASPSEVMRKINNFAAAVTPIITAMKDGNALYGLVEQNMKTLGLVDGDLDAMPLQTRLGAIHKHQEGEIKRLVGFIREKPGRTITRPPTLFSNNQPVVGLARNAPADLRALSQKYSQHPIAQQLMSEALRLGTAEVEKTKAAQTRPISNTSEQRKADLKFKPERENAPAERQNTEPSAPAARCADTVSSDDIDWNRPIEVGAELSGGGSSRSNEKDQPAAPEPEAKEPVAEDTLSEPPAEESLAAEKPVPPEAARQLARVAALSAEERAELLRPRTFGATGGSKPVPVTAKVEATIHGAAKPSSVPRGTHPTIDAWVEALDARDREARQLAALALKNDRKALKLALDELDAKTQARIRMDWEAQEARNRVTAEAEWQKSTDRTLLP